MKIHATPSFLRRLDVRCNLALLTLSLAVAHAGCAAPHAAVGPGIPGRTPIEGISVTGTGKAFGQPNIARATVGVEVRAATADVAMRDVSAGVARMIAALKGVGIAESDLATQDVSLNFEREELPPPRPVVEPMPAGPLKARPANAQASDASPDSKKSPAGNYRAQNTVVVKIRNLDKVGAVLGAATGAGANTMFGLAFQIDEPRQLEEQAREKAMADARARAEGLARLAGVRLGPVLYVQESSGAVPPPGPIMYRAQAAQAADVPIERGEHLVTITVNVLYSIAK
jgi:hypothetical protein